MAASPPATPGRIFISYRREDTAYPAGWLFDRLADHYGGGQIFKDVDSIQWGDDFVEVITRAVGSCDVLLVLIGDGWLTVADEQGRRRLDNPDDFVRLEVEAALALMVRVIPILVDGARMPRADELPGSLAGLVRRQALELSPARFDFDLGRLLKVLDRTITEAQARPAGKVAARGPVTPAAPPRDGPPREAAEPLIPSRAARHQAKRGRFLRGRSARPAPPPQPGPEPQGRPGPEPQGRPSWEPQARPGPESRPRPGAEPPDWFAGGPAGRPAATPRLRLRRRWRLWPLRRRPRAERPTPAAPTEEPVQRRRPEPDDEASFTVGYPGVVTPHTWYSLSVYVHLGRLQDEANRRIADQSRWFGLRPAASRAAAYVSLPKGTQLRVSPEVPGVVFNPPTQEVRWLEDLQQVGFRLQATSEAAGQTLLGAVEVHAGPLLVAQVPLSIHVRGADEPQERPEPAATSTGRLFSSVFASYAHEDDHIVGAFAEAYRALGIDVLVDKASLRAGEDWQRALLRLIEEADLFQLFWSEAASRSPYVAEEWQRALLLQDRKGERFIRPLYWTSPWPPPPAQLAHLHFAALDLAALSSVAGRSGA